MFWTLFPQDDGTICGSLPQDFETYAEAVEYAEEHDINDYIIESHKGELV